MKPHEVRSLILNWSLRDVRSEAALAGLEFLGDSSSWEGAGRKRKAEPREWSLTLPGGMPFVNHSCMVWVWCCYFLELRCIIFRTAWDSRQNTSQSSFFRWGNWKQRLNNLAEFSYKEQNQNLNAHGSASAFMVSTATMCCFISTLYYCKIK